MNNRRTASAMTAVLLLVGSLSAQVTTTAVPFLTISPDARSSAMGDAGVAMADDAWAIYWNPAGLAFQDGSEVGLDYSLWQPALDLGDVWITNSVYKQSLDILSGTVSASFTYLNQGEIGRTLNDPTVLETFKSYDLAVTLGYGTRISDVFGVGMNVRYIHSSLAPFGLADGTGSGSAGGVSFDVGILYKPTSFFLPFVNKNFGERLRVGFTLSNIGPQLSYNDPNLGDPLPLNMRLGFAFRSLITREHNITIGADFSRLLVNWTDSTADGALKGIFSSWSGGSFGDQLAKFVTGVGMEYWYGAPRLIAFRAGYVYEDPRNGNRKYLTFGAGVRVQSYSADFSYIASSEKEHPLGGTLRFSLSAAWGD